MASNQLGGRTAVASGLGLVLVLASSWSTLVNRIAPEPYLDEVFHVPQAQAYCEDRWYDWDDKITTPPGLYAVSRALSIFKSWLVGGACGTASLRQDNIVAAVSVFLLAASCRQKVEHKLNSSSGSANKNDALSTTAIQTGLNVALFPVLFFFSGLYYTDVWSTLSVLLAYNNHLNRVARPAASSFLSDIWTVLIGVVALTFRQTNVFWVVAYMGGLEVVHAVKALQSNNKSKVVASKPKAEAGAGSGDETEESFGEWIGTFLKRSAIGHVHDIPLHLAWPHDMAVGVISITIAAFSNPLRVVRQVWPHITVVGLFAAFVVWNDGVVLGDKANHVATIHIPQMLYLWPVLAFFSAPLFIPTLLRPIKAVFGSGSAESQSNTANTSSDNTKAASKDQEVGKAASDDTPSSLRVVVPPQIYCVPLIWVTVCSSWLAIHINTIIHPFTLADNRHYMFYVFRYTIRRSASLRDYLAPVYVACAWMCYSTLYYVPQAKRGRGSSIPVSAALLWLVATAPSLISAPLVEPRYFILPWVFWRLSVPSQASGDVVPSADNDGSSKGSKQPAANAGPKTQGLDYYVVSETVWHIAINAVTMAVFLWRPFEWPSEEGKLQRFMW